MSLSLSFFLGASASGRALAQERGTGFEAGLRFGYGVPLGKVTGPGGDLSEGISGQLPIWLDVGYRALPELFAGLYAQYGFGFMGDGLEAACDVSGVDCASSNLRLGAQVHYHPAPRLEVDPWLGVGLGYEWLNWSIEAAGTEVSFGTHGFEFLNLQAGLDIAVGHNFRIGPAISVSFAQYSEVGIDCSGTADCTPLGEVEGEIADQALHHWLVLGVRGAYAP